MDCIRTERRLSRFPGMPSFPQMFFPPLLIAIWVLSFAPMAVAGDIFVSTRGDDDQSGSEKEPLATLQEACDRAKPGDTVRVQKGVYSQALEFRTSGSKGGGFITLQADDKAVLTGKNGRRDVIEIYDQSYIRVIGFEIRDHSSFKEASGIRIEGSGSHIEIRNNTIHEIRGKNAMGITVYGTAEDRPLSKIVIDGNTIHHCDPAKSEALTLNGNIDGFEVTGNYVHNVNNIGIDFIGGEESIVEDPEKVVRNGVCTGNRVFRARASYGGGYAAGIYIDGARNIVVEGNTVSECDLGIEIGAENNRAIATGITVRNNVIYKNDKAGLVVGGYSRDVGRVEKCLFEGNVLFHNQQHKKAHAELWIQFAAGNSFRKNVIVSERDKRLVYAEPKGGKNTLRENTWYSADGLENARFSWHDEEHIGLNAFRSGSGQGEGSRFQMPVFSDPERGDFTRIEKAVPVQD